MLDLRQEVASRATQYIRSWLRILDSSDQRFDSYRLALEGLATGDFARALEVLVLERARIASELRSAQGREERASAHRQHLMLTSLILALQEDTDDPQSGRNSESNEAMKGINHDDQHSV